jgi:glucosamine-6-phosphate deaminase
VTAELRVHPDAVALGAALAGEIRRRYEATTGLFLLGCPSGRTMRTTYRALGEWRFERMVVVAMDDYVDAPYDAHFSCARFAHQEIAGPLGVPADQVWMPDATAPEELDRRIESAGGIDLFLLASGASDGHVAFVPPGSPRDGATAVLELAESTRRDNLATFPLFRSLDDVPRRGVSVGLGTIGAARALRMVLLGAGKREAAARLLALAAFDPGWPASIVHDHPDAEIWLDREARP